MVTLRRADEDSCVREFHLHAAANVKLLQIFPWNLQATCGIDDRQFDQVVLLAVRFLHAERFTCQLAVTHRDYTVYMTCNAWVVADNNHRKPELLIQLA